MSQGGRYTEGGTPSPTPLENIQPDLILELQQDQPLSYRNSETAPYSDGYNVIEFTAIKDTFGWWNPAKYTYEIPEKCNIVQYFLGKSVSWEGINEPFPVSEGASDYGPPNNIELYFNSQSSEYHDIGFYNTTVEPSGGMGSYYNYADGDETKTYMGWVATLVGYNENPTPDPPFIPAGTRCAVKILSIDQFP